MDALDEIYIVSTVLRAKTMQTITSREVQNRFGDFVESMNDDVVCVTRHGRPLFLAVSMRDDPSRLVSRVLLAYGQANAYRGDQPGKAMRELTASFGNRAAEDGFTEADVMQLVHDNRT